MNIGSKYQDLEPLKAISIKTIEVVAIDCAKLGASRKQGTEWSKYSKRWGILRRMLRFLFSPEFERMAETIDGGETDAELLRHALLEIMAGRRKLNDEVLRD